MSRVYDFEFDDLVDFRDSAIDSIFKIRKILQKIRINKHLSDGFKYIYNEVFAINGTASVLDLNSITAILTSLEDCARPLYLRRIEINDEVIEAFLDSCDRLEEVLDILDEEFYTIDELIDALNDVEVSDIVLYLSQFTRDDELSASKLDQGDVDTLLDELTV